jgi:hypothetical protein
MIEQSLLQTVHIEIIAPVFFNALHEQQDVVVRVASYFGRYRKEENCHNNSARTCTCVNQLAVLSFLLQISSIVSVKVLALVWFLSSRSLIKFFAIDMVSTSCSLGIMSF